MEKLKNIDKIRSVVTTSYEVVEKVKEGLFSNRTFLEETKAYSEKIIFENGKVSKSEALNFRLLKYNRPDVYVRSLRKYCNGLESSLQGFDANGKLIEEKSSEYFPSGKLRKETTYKYKADGKTEEEIVTYLYDSYNNMIEYSRVVDPNIKDKGMWWNNTQRTTEKYTWEYGNSKYCGRLEVEIGEDNSRVEYYYDFGHRLMEKIRFDKYGQNVFSAVYMYNSQGENYRTIYDGCYEDECRYDKYGNIIWMRWFPNMYRYDSSPLEKYKEAITTYEYRYDNYGNWVESKQFRNGVYNVLNTREIEYL